MYRKFREKEVATAARGLIGLFREINPAMLAKRARGRGADLGEYTGEMFENMGVVREIL